MTVPTAQPTPSALGITFTETMAGFIGEGAPGYRQGEALGRSPASGSRLRRPVTAPDLDAFATDHGQSTGTVRAGCRRQGADEPGIFNLFARDERAAGRCAIVSHSPARAGDASVSKASRTSTTTA
jgi:hypothetical protein